MGLPRPEHQQQEEIYGSLWRSLVRWLVANVGLLPSQRLALRADRLTFSTDEAATATLLVRDWSGEPPQVELSGGSAPQPQTFRCAPRGSYPGQYHVGLGRLPEGRYSIRVPGIDERELSGVAAFDVRGNLTERLDVGVQPNLMRLLAQQSGGEVLETVEPRLLAQQFDQHLRRTRPERHGADDGLGPLVGAAGRFCPVGHCLGASTPIGPGVEDGMA